MHMGAVLRPLPMSHGLACLVNSQSIMAWGVFGLDDDLVRCHLARPKLTIVSRRSLFLRAPVRLPASRASSALHLGTLLCMAGLLKLVLN